MEKDQNLELLQQHRQGRLRDSAPTAALRPRLRLRAQVQCKDGTHVQQDESRYAGAQPRRQWPAPPLWCHHRRSLACLSRVYLRVACCSTSSLRKEDSFAMRIHKSNFCKRCMCPPRQPLAPDLSPRKGDPTPPHRRWGGGERRLRLTSDEPAVPRSRTAAVEASHTAGRPASAAPLTLSPTPAAARRFAGKGERNAGEHFIQEIASNMFGGSRSSLRSPSRSSPPPIVNWVGHFPDRTLTPIRITHYLVTAQQLFLTE
jgi:hypothetical protein